MKPVCGRPMPRQRRKRPPVFSAKTFLECAECGVGFLRRVSVQKVRNRHPNSKGGGPFCSKKCNGAWLGKHHGFGMRKEVV